MLGTSGDTLVFTKQKEMAVGIQWVSPARLVHIFPRIGQAATAKDLEHLQGGETLTPLIKQQSSASNTHCQFCVDDREEAHS